MRGSQNSQIFLQSSMENSFRISLRTLGYIIAYCKNYWRKNAIFCYFAASSFSPVLKLKRFNKEVSKLNNLNYKIPSVAKYRFTNLLMTLELFFLLNSTRNRLRERVKTQGAKSHSFMKPQHYITCQLRTPSTQYILYC